MRVLVVEDDEKIASFVSKGLREAGFEIICGEKCITTRESKFHKFRVIRCEDKKQLSSAETYGEALTIAYKIIAEGKKIQNPLTPKTIDEIFSIKKEEVFTYEGSYEYIQKEEQKELAYEDLIEPATERQVMPHELNRFTGLILDEADDFFVDTVKESAPEKEVRLLLEKVGFTVKHYKEKTEHDPADVIYEQFPFKRMKLDFALPQALIAIEVQGDYWHGNSTTLSVMQVKNKLRDDRKKRSLARHKWKLLEIWERDLKRPDEIKKDLYTKIICLMDL